MELEEDTWFSLRKNLWIIGNAWGCSKSLPHYVLVQKTGWLPIYDPLGGDISICR